MFQNLSERLSNTVRKLKGAGRITEENIKDSLREVRITLIEADVALPVVKTFVERIKTKAIGQQVHKSLQPGDALVKIVLDELVLLMGESFQSLNFRTQPPAIILLAGLQGSGKTTTTAKLANWLQQDQKKSVMIASADIYRPAAIKQLEILAGQINAQYFSGTSDDNPVEIAKAAIQKAKQQFLDVVIIDTAGRLHIDNTMMAEIKNIYAAINPIETIFVVDSMTGQDAANTAKAFNDALPLTGVILTKTDGDARGGAALTIREITGKPIKFMGTGEKIEAFEPFHPERLASRILGMGDILTLVEEIERKVDKKKAEKITKKLKKGKSFDFEDFRDQLQQMRNMGGLGALIGKLPGGMGIPQAAKNMMDDKMLVKMEAIINSMTKQERKFPGLLKGSRKRRIATGSGTHVQDINKLLKQFTQMQKMLKKMKGGNMAKMMKRMQGMMPPGHG